MHFIQKASKKGQDDKERTLFDSGNSFPGYAAQAPLPFIWAGGGSKEVGGQGDRSAVQLGSGKAFDTLR